MKQEALTQFTHPDLMLFGFLLFFFCFMGVLVWTLLTVDRRHYRKMALLPLINDLHGVNNERE